MLLKINEPVTVFDGTALGKSATIPAGEHEMERINNPYTDSSCQWIVLKGTKIGMSIEAWERLRNSALATANREGEKSLEVNIAD